MRSRTQTSDQHGPAPMLFEGTLAVKWINGRNGDFAVGELRTGVGDFKVKDALIEQFEEGEYQGRFWVSHIFPKSYEYHGRITVELRAHLAGLDVDRDNEAPLRDEPSSNEPDPACEPPPPAPEVVVRKPSAPVAESGVPDDEHLDAELFGSELHQALTAAGLMRLDPTVDRLLFRRQTSRLKQLGYRFDAKTQTWHPSSSGP